MDLLAQFNFCGFSISCPLKILSIIIGATLKGKNMLPMGSIFFPLIVAPFKTFFLYDETYSTVFNLIMTIRIPTY